MDRLSFSFIFLIFVRNSKNLDPGPCPKSCLPRPPGLPDFDTKKSQFGNILEGLVM
jgi:hypothetical protein